MRWKKLGRVFAIEKFASRGTTHAQLPTAWDRGDVIRVFFSARNHDGQAYPISIDVDRNDLTKVISVHEKPLLEFGACGTFDHNGVMPNHAISVRDEVWMYYSGWTRCTSVPYAINSGLAVSRDRGDTFQRKFQGPVLDRSPTDPFMAMTPWVLHDGMTWKMWYVSGTAWKVADGQLEPVYSVRYATSPDGIFWQRSEKELIPQLTPDESHAHPTVAKIGDRYHMWYCVRALSDFRGGSGSYRVGYSHSSDGLNWTRDDEKAGIGASTSGWDSTMFCYPYVIEVEGHFYMFFNGNDFGQTGIGLAILE